MGLLLPLWAGTRVRFPSFLEGSMLFPVGGMSGRRRCCRENWGSAEAGRGGRGFHKRQGGVLFGVAGSSRI